MTTIDGATQPQYHDDVRVRCEIEQGVADVQLARPDKMNAVDALMLSELRETALSLRTAQGLRAVVLSGQGRAFCSGLDLAVLSDMSAGLKKGWAPGDSEPEAAALGLSPAQYVVWLWATMPVPVIAALHGTALGAGLQLSLAADVRIVAPDAKLGLLEVRWGVVPDMLATHFLPLLVGPERAIDLTITSSTVTGDEAAAMGLASRTATEPRSAALSLARVIAQRSPTAVRAAKSLVRSTDEDSLRQAAQAEQAAMAQLMGSRNQVESVRAASEKREPRFADV